MTAVRAWIGDAENDAASSEGIPESLRQTVIHSICLNSTGTVAPAKVWPFGHIRISVFTSSSLYYNMFCTEDTAIRFFVHDVCPTINFDCF